MLLNRRTRLREPGGLTGRRVQMIKKALLFITLFSSANAFSHSDTIIQLLPDGNLIGFPEQYSPAHFDVSTWVLSIAESQFTFPACISKELSGVDKDKLFFASSWYHSAHTIFGTEYPRLPDYLTISLNEIEFEVLINLNTSKPFSLERPFKELTHEQICELLKSPNKSNQAGTLQSNAPV